MRRRWGSASERRPAEYYSRAVYTIISTTYGTYVSTIHWNSMISPFPFQVFFFVSSEFPKRRLSKWLRAHSMRYRLAGTKRALRKTCTHVYIYIYIYVYIYIYIYMYTHICQSYTYTFIVPWKRRTLKKFNSPNSHHHVCDYQTRWYRHTNACHGSRQWYLLVGERARRSRLGSIWIPALEDVHGIRPVCVVIIGWSKNHFNNLPFIISLETILMNTCAAERMCCVVFSLNAGSCNDSKTRTWSQEAEVLGGAPRSSLKSGGSGGYLLMLTVSTIVFIEVGANFSWGWNSDYENRS